MARKTRLIILLACGLFFFITAPAVIVYSLGYRFDFDQKKLSATGGVFIKAWPESAEVFIDSKFSGKTKLFAGSIFAQNLLPKQHNILVKKEGYFPYQKTLDVKEKEVVKIEHILLFKENILFDVLKNEEESPFKKQEEINNKTELSPDGTRVLFYDDYEILFSFVWQLNQPEPEKKFLNRFSEKISRVLWLNNDYIVFTVGGKIKITEIDNKNNVNIVTLPEKLVLSDGTTVNPLNSVNGKEPEIYFSQQDKKLYILAGDKTLVSEKIAP